MHAYRWGIAAVGDIVHVRQDQRSLARRHATGESAPGGHRRCGSSP